MMALLARYHRGAVPDASHEHFGRLSPGRRRRTRQLSALLRIAENLDRSHFQNVVALRTSLTDTALHVLVATKADPQLEVWAAETNGGLFEDAFGRALHVTPTEIPTHAPGESDPTWVPEPSLQS